MLSSVASLSPYFSVCSIDADVFMNAGLADRGASHFCLDAVQVQGTVLTSAHCYRVDGHLLVRRRSQWNIIFMLAVAVISLLLFGANIHFFFMWDLKVVVIEGNDYVACDILDQFVSFFIELARSAKLHF